MAPSCSRYASSICSTTGRRCGLIIAYVMMHGGQYAEFFSLGINLICHLESLAICHSQLAIVLTCFCAAGIQSYFLSCIHIPVHMHNYGMSDAT